MDGPVERLHCTLTDVSQGIDSTLDMNLQICKQIFEQFPTSLLVCKHAQSPSLLVYTRLQTSHNIVSVKSVIS